jgi:hypothetical protein
MENLMNNKTGNNSHSLACIDSITSDEYRMNILLENSSGYTKIEVMEAIDSTLNEKGINHERIKIQNNEAIIINYGGAVELEVLTNDLSYYFVLVSEDSVMEKFQRTIKTIDIKTN